MSTPKPDEQLKQAAEIINSLIAFKQETAKFYELKAGTSALYESLCKTEKIEIEMLVLVRKLAIPRELW